MLTSSDTTRPAAVSLGTEPTPAAYKSDWFDLIARAAEAAAKSGISAAEAMAGADFVLSVYWDCERGEEFPSYLDNAKLDVEGDTDAR